MKVSEALGRRMRGLGLWAPRTATPAEIVGDLVAVQAQEFPYALWSLAQRISPETRPGAAEVAVDYDAGAFLRTHVMRPTWHFVTPADARWLLTLTAPRVHRLGDLYYRRSGLDAATRIRAADAIAAAVANGAHRTRAELQEALARAGIPLAGNPLAYAVMFAELERVVISGASIGKQRCYAAFDERVPPTFVAGSATFDRELALAELAARYFATRGPASVKDMAAWSGLTLGECRTGLRLALERAPGSLEGVEIAGVQHWLAPDAPAVAPASPRVDLLQGYDEYVCSYTETRSLMQPDGYAPPKVPVSLFHAALLDGRLVAMWKHTLARTAATITLQPLVPAMGAWTAEFERAAADYGDFLGLPVALEYAR